jgi:hypothetical protein
MTLIRSEVTIEPNGAAPQDVAINTVYHTSATDFPFPGVDWQNHADEVRDCFAGAASSGAGFVYYKGRRITVKCYDMADPKPRPEKAVSIFTPLTVNWDTIPKLSPMQVALCLSFYADRNLKSQRGRIFIGPFAGFSASAGLILAYAPTTVIQDGVLALGHALFDVGGANVSHVVYSPKHTNVHVITDYWVDDRWDTIRGRLTKPTGRHTLHP